MNVNYPPLPACPDHGVTCRIAIQFCPNGQPVASLTCWVCRLTWLGVSIEDAETAMARHFAELPTETED